MSISNSPDNKKKRKRANGEGNVYERRDKNGKLIRYEGTITVGFRENGNIKRKTFTGKTRGEVMKKMTEALNSLNKGTYFEPSKITLEEWLDEWFKTYVLPIKKPSTADGYHGIIRRYLKPSLGRILLAKLRPEQLQNLYNDYIGKLSPTTLKHINVMLHTSLEQARKNKLITENITDLVELPKLKKKEIQFLELWEQKKLLEVTSQLRLGFAIEFILATGLRQSELLGLRWEDVNFTKGCIYIRQTIMRKKNFDSNDPAKTKIIIGTPKTLKGERTIYLPPIIVKKLNEHRKSQLEEKLQLGDMWQENNLVFASELGTPVESSRLTKTLYSLLKTAGLKKRGVHSLRHTFSTRAIENGMDVKTLSELLGHEDITTTLNLYVHSSDDTKREEMNKLNHLFQ